MIPSLAHIHTVWFIQFGELWWRISHEGFRFYPSHGLSLLRLDFLSVQIQTPVGFLRPNDLTAPSFVTWRSIGAIGSGSTIFGGAGGAAALFLILRSTRTFGPEIAGQPLQWFFEE